MHLCIHCARAAARRGAIAGPPQRAQETSTLRNSRAQRPRRICRAPKRAAAMPQPQAPSVQLQHRIRPPASLPLSAHAHRCFRAPPHESAPRPQHHARAGGHLRKARRIWVRAACAYAWPRHTTHNQPRAAHVYIRAGPPEQARTAPKRQGPPKKARTVQLG